MSIFPRKAFHWKGHEDDKFQSWQVIIYHTVYSTCLLRLGDDRGGPAGVGVGHQEAGVVLVPLRADLRHLQPPVAVADEEAWKCTISTTLANGKNTDKHHLHVKLK